MPLPVSMEEARRQLQLAANDDTRDDEIAGFIADAAAWVEGFTGHILDQREVTEHVSGFKPVELRAWPIAADALPGVAYSAADGTPIAVPGARLDITRRPARVSPGSGLFWPFRDSAQRFTVTVTAGYASAGAVPRDFKRAMLILIAAYDADREGGDVFEKAEKAAKRICDRFRLRRL